MLPYGVERNRHSSWCVVGKECLPTKGVCVSVLGILVNAVPIWFPSFDRHPNSLGEEEGGAG